MRKLSVLILIIILISGGFSCNKEKLVGVYYLSEERKSLIPFNGYEKLVFDMDSINMIELLASQRSDTMYKILIDPHYEEDYILCESDYIYFSSSEYAISLRVGACDFDPRGVGFHFVYLDGNYMFARDILVNVDDSNTQVLDSLMVNGSWIHEVFFDTLYYVHHQPFPQDLLCYPNKCYYSTSLGVVRIDFSDGSSWELEEIIWK